VAAAAQKGEESSKDSSSKLCTSHKWGWSLLQGAAPGRHLIKEQMLGYMHAKYDSAHPQLIINAFDRPKRIAVSVWSAPMQDMMMTLLTQVVRISTVEDTESDKLLKTSIDVGNGESRQVGERSLPLSGDMDPMARIVVPVARQ